MFWGNEEYTFDDWHGYVYQTTRHKDGGARKWHNEIIQSIKILSNDKSWNRCLDWGAGDGGLGLALLGEKMVQDCVFMDHYLPAVDGCKANLDLNKLDFEVVHLDKISDLDSGKFDMVVSNPPHHRICSLNEMYEIGWLDVRNDLMQYKDALEESNSKKPHRHYDLYWKTHVEFYQNITNHLNEGADLFMFENGNASNPLRWEWGDFGCYVLHLRYK